MVELGAVARFLGVGDVLAEIIHADAEAGLIDGFGRLQYIFCFQAGDKTAGEFLSQRGALRQAAQRFAFRKADEEGAEHGDLRELEFLSQLRAGRCFACSRSLAASRASSVLRSVPRPLKWRAIIGRP